MPATVAEVADGYEMGAGEMRVDLRDVDLPPGRTTLPVEIGMGEIQVLVPDDTCVTVDADISMGAYEPPDGGEEGGVDLEIDDRFPVAAGRPELHVVADVGLGALRVGDGGLFDRRRLPADGTTPRATARPGRCARSAHEPAPGIRPGAR